MTHYHATSAAPDQLYNNMYTLCLGSECIFTGRNEVVAKVIFLQVSVCPQGGRVSASVHAGMPYPPDGGTPPDGDPPGWRTPRDGDPPGMENPPRMENPPDEDPRPGKQTPAYGLRAVGTHPTGMHSCSLSFY